MVDYKGLKVFTVKNILFLFLVLTLLLQFLFLIWNTIWTQGDEPHYIVATQSLIRDFDLNLTNNMVQKDYCEHHCEPNFVLHANVDKVGNLRPVHGYLLSFITAPGYVLAKMLGARITIFLIHLLGVFLIYIFLSTILEFSKSYTLFTLICYNLSLPVFLYSRLIFPDFMVGYMYLSGFISAWVFIQNKNKFWLIISSLMASLPILMHTKYLVLTVLFLLSFGIYTKLHDFKKLKFKDVFCFILPFIAVVMTYSFISIAWYGKIVSNAVDLKDTSQFIGNPFIGFFGQLLDREFGLFVNSPIWLLLIPGLQLAWKNYKQITKFVLFPILVYYVLTSFFNQWYAGYAPGPRFIMTFLPFLTFPLCLGVRWVWSYITGRVFIIGIFLENIFLIFAMTKTSRFGWPWFLSYNDNWRVILKKFGALSLEGFIGLDYYAHPTPQVIFIGVVFSSFLWYLSTFLISKSKS